MKETFGILPSGEAAALYTIHGGGITAAVTDYGASLVRLLVPDKNGALADVVLGYDDCNATAPPTVLLWVPPWAAIPTVRRVPALS